MNCQRCNGLMVEDYFFDVQESFGETWIRGWRCLCCGEVVDPLIQSHRLLQSVNMPVLEEEPVVEEECEEYSIHMLAS